MLKERSTYEIMRPEDVGLAKTDLVLGKHSGRALWPIERERWGLRSQPNNCKRSSNVSKSWPIRKKMFTTATS